MRARAAAFFVISAACAVITTADAGAAIPPPLRNDTWLRATSAHFDVLGNVDRGELVEIARKLERLAETLEQIEPSLAARGTERLRVYAFDGEATFKHFTLPNVENLLGYCLTTSNETRLVFNARPPEDPRGPVTLYHEFTHAYLHGNFQHLPLWLNEGLAQYYSTFVPGERSAEIGRPIAVAAEWCRNHALYPLETLFAIDGSSPQYRGGEDRATFYSQSWALVSYLAATSSRDSNAFERYLNRLWRGQNPTLAFEAVYPPSTWAALLAGLKRYVESGEYIFKRYTFTAPFDPARLVVDAVSTPDLLADIGDLLLLRHEIEPVDLDRAAEHYRSAVAADPDHAHGLAGQGYVYDLQGQTAAAESLYNRAYGADPKDPKSCLMAGRGALRRFENAPELSRTAVLLLAARARFVCCLARSPHDTQALIGYGRSYRLHSGPPEFSAIAALTRAFHARPDRVDLLWDLLDLTVRAELTSRTDSLLEEMKARVPEQELRRWRDRRGDARAHVAIQEGVRELNRENHAAALEAFRRAQSSDDARVRTEAKGFARRTEVRMMIAAASVHLLNRRAARARSALDSLTTAIASDPEAKSLLSDEFDHARLMLADAEFQVVTDQALDHVRSARLQSAKTEFTRALKFARDDPQKAYVQTQLQRLDAAMRGRR